MRGGGVSQHAATVMQRTNRIFKSIVLELLGSGIYNRDGRISKSQFLDIAVESNRVLLFDAEQGEALE